MQAINALYMAMSSTSSDHYLFKPPPPTEPQTVGALTAAVIVIVLVVVLIGVTAGVVWHLRRKRRVLAGTPDTNESLQYATAMTHVRSSKIATGSRIDSFQSLTTARSSRPSDTGGRTSRRESNGSSMSMHGSLRKVQSDTYPSYSGSRASRERARLTESRSHKAATAGRPRKLEPLPTVADDEHSRGGQQPERQPALGTAGSAGRAPRTSSSSPTAEAPSAQLTDTLPR